MTKPDQAEDTMNTIVYQENLNNSWYDISEHHYLLSSRVKRILYINPLPAEREEAIVKATIERCAQVCNDEKLVDETNDELDLTYDNAIDHVENAIRQLSVKEILESVK